MFVVPRRSSSLLSSLNSYGPYKMTCIFFPYYMASSEILNHYLVTLFVGIGWTFWKKRWFILTRTSLLFFRNDPVSVKLKYYLIIVINNISLYGGGNSEMSEEYLGTDYQGSLCTFWRLSCSMHIYLRNKLKGRLNCDLIV